MMRLFINKWLEIKIAGCHVRPDFCLEVSYRAKYDASIYKCVARNKDSRVSCEARLLLGGTL